MRKITSRFNIQKFISTRYTALLLMYGRFFSLKNVERGIKMQKTEMDVVNEKGLLLAPYVKSLLAIGPTASGKTALVKQFASVLFHPLLDDIIGEGSGTVREKRFIFTTALKDQLIVAVKPQQPYVPYDDFVNKAAGPLADLISRDHKKIREMEQKQLDEELTRRIAQQFLTKNNTEAQYHLIDEKIIDAIVEKLSKALSPFALENASWIYNESVNNTDDKDIKKHSRKLKELILMNTVTHLQANMETRKVLDELYNELEFLLGQKFLTYFNDSDVSDDGYFFVELHHHQMDCEFAKAFFTNNDLQKGKRLSIEVLCEEILIYMPMNSALEMNFVPNEMNENYVDKELQQAYGTFDGHYSFSLEDTRGLYHNSEDDEAEKANLRNFLYNKQYDALLVVLPLVNNPNQKKMIGHLSEILEHYRKEVPFILIGTKADEFADSIRKDEAEAEEDDLEETIDPKDMAVLLKAEYEDLTRPIRESMVRKNPAITMPVMFKKPLDKLDRKSLYPLFSPLQVVPMILSALAKDFLLSNTRIRFELENEGAPFRVQKSEVFKVLRKFWLHEPSVKSQVIDPSLDNISKNSGLVPHGNSWNALVNHLRNGCGWVSNINEDYFGNCKNITITFPTNVQNFIKPGLIIALLDSAVEFNGEITEEKDKEEFRKKVIHYSNPATFAAALLYRHIMANVLSTKYGKERFAEFLKASDELLRTSDNQFRLYHEFIENGGKQNVVPDKAEHVQKMTSALADVLNAALMFVFNYHVKQA
ncbi:hypothetical protein B5M42_021480 [Paenibacillus athensensis]|uniref:Uncharacterized protein n=1 Tax=Paenibacillus athensensis TaxID=1967502 RepID=A0A4Y8Q0Q0_9BACL|nr:hypothetical protein [Paenibacillus athensensis]MCD1261377.1 hypothetical protein [Paenibacillus athensensis]